MENTADEQREVIYSAEELIKRYAEIQGISEEEALLQVGAPTKDEILEKIKEKTLEKVKANTESKPQNRAQRRALMKKFGKNKYQTISETATKLNMVHLIQQLRKLNEEKEKEIQENGGPYEENN